MPEKKPQNLTAKAPVVVVLGHVDHGKSSLLEAIKDFKITAKESGGITQHIGAYEVEHRGKMITFIDTPGHEAFSAMRSRGAKIADIALLVVDASEGIKAQTKEAIFHIKLAQIPMIAVLNKMDKPQANPIQVKMELDGAGIKVESLGGKIPSIEVSAKTKQGIEELLELILLVAEMENLQSDPSGPAEGVVVESYIDSRRGPTATLLIKKGTLHKGDVVATNSSYGKAKTLEDFQGVVIEEAPPSKPAVIIGFETVPQVGEQFKVCQDMETAKQTISLPEKKSGGRVIFIDEGKKVLNLVIKADFAGSLDAIESVLKALPQEEVILRILDKGVGAVNENDIKLVRDGRAKIVGFRVKTDVIAQKLAERDKIRMMTFDIIYELVQAVRILMAKMMEPEIVRQDLGRMKVLIVFKTDKRRQIIGGRIVEGEINRGVQIDVLRPTAGAKTKSGEEGKIGKGRVIELQKNKKEIDKGTKGDEVGILYEGDGPIQEGDILVIYKEEKKKLDFSNNFQS